MALSDAQKKFLEENFERARENFSEAKKTTLKALLIVTTGTFVLSISFLTAFSDKSFHSVWALMLSWTCMALSIGTYIALAHHDAEAEGAVIDDIAEKMRGSDLPVGYRPGTTGDAAKFYTKANGFLILTYQLAALGIILLLYFGVTNFAAKSIPQQDPGLRIRYQDTPTGEIEY